MTGVTGVTILFSIISIVSFIVIFYLLRSDRRRKQQMPRQDLIWQGKQIQRIKQVDPLDMFAK